MFRGISPSRRVVPSPRSLLAAAGLVLACGASLASGAVRVWTDAEKACAQAIGVDLNVPPDAASATYERRLAWHAELVVYATVAALRHDVRGSYATLAELAVTRVLAGTPPSGPVHVALVSGPTYHAPGAVIVERTRFGEPRFAVGESVLLFLYTDYPEPRENPDELALAPGHYRLVHDAKWIVDGDTLLLDGGAGQGHGKSWLETEVALATQARADCR